MNRAAAIISNTTNRPLSVGRGSLCVRRLPTKLPITAVGTTTTAITELLGRVPIFGICLGHQLLATALGATTYKLPFGHHGGNHPVQRLETGGVEITSQNHNFAVRADSLGGRATITHVNLNDGVCEGFRVTCEQAFSVQHHPEANPGPHDARHLFDRFAVMIDRVGVR